MTRELRTGDLEIELGTGTWTARWPACGVVGGPFEGRVHVADEVRASAGQDGRWRVETGAGYGRAGAWARWTPTGDGPRLALHVPAVGDTIVVELSYRAPKDVWLDRLIPLTGPIDVGGALADATRLVDGYDSWAYAGVRAASQPGASWSHTAVVRGDQRAALTAQALDAARFATAMTTTPEQETLRLQASCGATPTFAPVPGTWGYELMPPSALDLPVPAGTDEHSPPIALSAGADPFAVVEGAAALAGVLCGRRTWDGPPIAGWESWYYYGLFVEPRQVLANARLLRERFRDIPGFDLVQIDDGWQVTYGAWSCNDRFPPDLTSLVEDLHELGCRAGLWLAPFMVQPNAPGVATDHPEWLVHESDGALAIDRHGRAALDASHPDALQWLRDLGAQVRAWGFEMVKLDFLYLGAIEGPRHETRITGTEALRRGLRSFIDGLGDDVYVLACGAPLLPLVGLCHGNRVGHDLAVPVALREFGQPLDDGWTGFHGIRPQARNVAARWALHRRWFECDPDVVMAWGSNEALEEGGYTLEESRTLATLAALCGGPFLLADDLATLRDAERAVLEDRAVLGLSHGAGFRPVDLFEQPDRVAAEHFFEQAATPEARWVAERDGQRVEARFNLSDLDRSDVPAHGVRLVSP